MSINVRNLTAAFSLTLAVLGLAGAVVVAPVSVRPAIAQDEEESSTTTEPAKSSKLLTGLPFPAGGHRITSKKDLATLTEQLTKVGPGMKPKAVEAVVWSGADGAEARRKAVVASMKKQGFQYMPQQTNTKGETSLTVFGAINEPKKQGVLGFWMEGKENGIQILVWGKIGDKTAEPTEEPAEEKTEPTAPSEAGEAPAR